MHPFIELSMPPFPRGAHAHTECSHVVCPLCASWCWGDSSNKTEGLPVLTASSHVSQAHCLVVGRALVSIAIPHAISQGHQRASDSNGLGVICDFRHFPHDRN